MPKPNFRLIKTAKQLEAISTEDLNFLTLAYVELELLCDRFLENNSKLHELSKIEESVKVHGFKNPLKYDPSLNGGNGGIQAGNGRLACLRGQYDNGADVPKGVIDNDEIWFVPVIFGVNDDSEEMAIAYSIVDNIASTWGSSLEWVDLSKMFDPEKLNSQLNKLQKSNHQLDFFQIDVDALKTLNKQISSTQQTVPGPQDAPEEQLDELWGVIITCDDESHQIQLLNEFKEKGLNCRAIIN